MKTGILVMMAGAALAGPVAARTTTQASDPRLAVLEQQLRDVQAQLAQIKARQTDGDSATAIGDLKRSTDAHVAALNTRLDKQARVGLDNGRLSVASADGAFTLSLRSLIQLDIGYFAQGRNPASVDLNSGTNFRRAQLGVTGTAWRDWSYNFIYDFGGSGVEKSGYIYSAYFQYDGLKPFGVRVGAFTPALGIEDQTGSGDLLFLERPASVDVARNIAGSPSREGVAAFAQGDNYLFSVTYTGKKVTDAATFDAQQAVLGRAAWLAVNTGTVKWLLDADATQVLKVADANPSPSAIANTVSFSNGPELSVDASKTVNTGNIDARKVTEFGFETAASTAGFYGQGGWFHYHVNRQSALPSPDFSGWYALLTYSLTGEKHPYDATTASFRSLKPVHPLGSPGGWGAWEIKARYSDVNLDYLPFATAATGGIAGGKQDIWTLGVNWYPTSGIRFELDYDNLQVNHVNALAGDISANAIALRSQFSL